MTNLRRRFQAGDPTPLSFPVSLMLALLRKNWRSLMPVAAIPAWYWSGTAWSKWCAFSCPKARNEARLIDQIEATLNKVVELGFLKN